MTSKCKGTTKNGEQCKITGTFRNGYCHLHKNQYLPPGKNISIESSEQKNPEKDSISEHQTKTNFHLEKDAKQKNLAILKIMLIVVFILFLLSGLNSIMKFLKQSFFSRNLL